MHTSSARRLAASVVMAATLVMPVALTARAAPPRPKVTALQAEAAATRKIPGRATSAKYEFEDGRWQYAVLVKDKKGRLYEVEVNATTGKVMDSERTSAAEEAKEAAADKKAALKAKGHAPSRAESGGKGEAGRKG